MSKVITEDYSETTRRIYDALLLAKEFCAEQVKAPTLSDADDGQFRLYAHDLAAAANLWLETRDLLTASRIKREQVAGKLADKTVECAELRLNLTDKSAQVDRLRDALFDERKIVNEQTARAQRAEARVAELEPSDEVREHVVAGVQPGDLVTLTAARTSDEDNKAAGLVAHAAELLLDGEGELARDILSLVLGVSEQQDWPDCGACGYPHKRSAPCMSCD